MKKISIVKPRAGGRRLGFCRTDLTLVPPEVMVGAIQRLEEVEVLDTEKTVKLINGILTMVKEDRQGRLKDLKIIKLKSSLRVSVSPTLLQEARQNTSVKISVIL